MQTFQTDRKKYIDNLIGYWQINILIVALILIVLNIFKTNSTSHHTANSSLFTLLGFILLIKLVDMIRQYHVKEIVIDKENDKLRFKLKSMLSGEKEKAFSLSQVSTITKENRWFNHYVSGPKSLVISLPANQKCIISSRYGFPTETLQQIGATING
jgi:hypothetical protein